jgi:hypothetical protein
MALLTTDTPPEGPPPQDRSESRTHGAEPEDAPPLGSTHWRSEGGDATEPNNTGFVAYAPSGSAIARCTRSRPTCLARLASIAPNHPSRRAPRCDLEGLGLEMEVRSKKKKFAKLGKVKIALAKED